MNITEFLTARIAEDEGLIEGQLWDWRTQKRLRAECAAKRAIVELHKDAGESQGYTEQADYGYIPNCCGTCGTFGEYGEPFPCDTLRTLAAVYADHQDYRDEWRVGV